MASLLRKRSASARVRRSVKTRATRRKPSSEYYTIYIGDFQEDGVTRPVMGTASRQTLDALGISLKEAQTLPGGGKYTSATGLKFDYNFNDGVLFKTTTGRLNSIDYDSTLPIPVVRHANKLAIYVEGSKTSGGTIGGSGTKRVQKKYEIGIPSGVGIASVAEFVIRTKIDRSPKTLRWRYAKSTTTVRAFSGSGNKLDKQGSWYIPVGFDANAKRNKDGSGSKADFKQRLVVATISESAARALGFEKAKETNVAALSQGTNIVKTLANNGTGDRVYSLKVFAKPELYEAVYEGAKTGDTPTKLEPGTGTTVRCRFKLGTGAVIGQRTQGASTAAASKKKRTSTSIRFKLPAETDISMIYQFLAACKRKPVSFQVSTDDKTFGKSYPLPVGRSAKLAKAA